MSHPSCARVGHGVRCNSSVAPNRPPLIVVPTLEGSGIFARVTQPSAFRDGYTQGLTCEALFGLQTGGWYQVWLSFSLFAPAALPEWARIMSTGPCFTTTLELASAGAGRSADLPGVASRVADPNGTDAIASIECMIKNDVVGGCGIPPDASLETLLGGTDTTNRFADFFNSLRGIGYSDYVDLFAATYDWRRSVPTCRGSNPRPAG